MTDAKFPFMMDRGGEVLTFGGLTATIKVPSTATGGSVAVVEHTLEPGRLGAPLHRHEREDETSYVLEGELTAQVGEAVVTLGPGSYLVKPRGVFHTFWNGGSGFLRFIEVISPGGFEGYFEELSRLVRPDAPPDFAAIAALAARYGMEQRRDLIPEYQARYGVRLG